MDEALEVLEVAEQFGLDGVVSWVLRAVGFLLVLAGLGLWLFTDAGLLVVPAALLVVGVLLLVATEALFVLVELV
ncbi:hypothetical protein ACFR9U_08330 [Halorientalis brevis]|uniref:Uncharacterized protein n=1 Tax=Halorientalis brevis TaxID=1126241 RepID=A0ABD6CC33_9EURY|nr:hypothetical protein [Halorientalis brevis]